MLERKQLQVEPATVSVVSLMFWNPDPNDYVALPSIGEINNPFNLGKQRPILQMY